MPDRIYAFKHDILDSVDFCIWKFEYFEYDENPKKVSCFDMTPHDTKILDRFIYASDALDYEEPVSLDRS